MDLDALAATGLDDGTPERRALLAFLVEEGCTVEEMRLAHARGRLFALAGDRRIRPLVGLLTLREAATCLDEDPAVLARAWRTLGLPDPGVDTAVLTDADVQALRTYLDVRALLGDDTALGVGRVLGAALARITEAETAAMRSAMDAIDVGLTGDEVVTARAYSAATSLVPRIGQMLDALHRQHLEATRLHFEDMGAPDSVRPTFRCGVGFADLSGFTALSQQLALDELSPVLTTFEEGASDTVHALGGRIVKFLGDAVMWVSTAPDDTAAIARALTSHPKALEAGIAVRAGVAYGQLLVQDGDYFGTPVNLASRLVALAEPGQVLAAGDLVDLLGDGWLAVPGVARAVRGFDAPVTPWVLTAR